MPDWLALGISFLFFSVWFILLHLKYHSFGYSDWDLGFYSQAMWNLSANGDQYSSIFDRNLLGNHSNLIAFLFIPLYRVFPHPLTLILSKLLVLVLAGIVLYRYAKPKLGGIAAIICMLLYLLYPANLFSIIYEFDFESLSPVFLFLLYVFYTQKNFRGFLCAAIFTILIKENLSLIVCAFGLTGLFSREKLKWGVIPLAMGSISFFYLIQVLIPYFSVLIPHFPPIGKHPYLYLYSELGQTPAQIAWKLLSTPSVITKQILTPWMMHCLFKIFAPLAFTPFFALQTMFYALPILTLRIFASAYQQMTIYFYYGASLAPFLFLAMVNTLSWVRGKSRKIFSVVLTIIILCSAQGFCLELNVMKGKLFSHNDRFQTARWNLVKSIPTDAPVIATFDFLAELSRRKDLYAFFKVFHFNAGPETFSLPASRSYALVDFMDPWLLNDLKAAPASTSKAIRDFFLRDNWDVVQAYEDLVLFKKLETPCPNCLLEISDKPFSRFEAFPVMIDDMIELHNFQDIAISAHQEFPVSQMTFFWRAAKDVGALYIVKIVLKQGDRIVTQRFHCIGYAMFPTTFWKDNDHIKENYWLWLPSLSKGEYTLELSAFRQQKHGFFGQVPIKLPGEGNSSGSNTIQAPFVIN